MTEAEKRAKINELLRQLDDENKKLNIKERIRRQLGFTILSGIDETSEKVREEREDESGRKHIKNNRDKETDNDTM